MATVSQTIAAFALTLSDAEHASRLFDLARVIEGHQPPCAESFRAMQSLLSNNSALPDFLPQSGLHRQSFALRAARDLAIKVFDLPEQARDYAGLLKVNATALLAVSERLPLDKLAQTISPVKETAPMFYAENTGPHGSTALNTIYLPGMVLTYTTVGSTDGSMSYKLGLWLLCGQHTHAEARTHREAVDILQAWVKDPSKAFSKACAGAEVAMSE